MFKQLSSAFMQQPDSQVVIFISINSLVFINLNIFFNSMCTSQCPLQMDNFLFDKQADKSFRTTGQSPTYILHTLHSIISSMWEFFLCIKQLTSVTQRIQDLSLKDRSLNKRQNSGFSLLLKTCFALTHAPSFSCNIFINFSITSISLYLIMSLHHTLCCHVLLWL